MSKSWVAKRSAACASGGSAAWGRRKGGSRRLGSKVLRWALVLLKWLVMDIHQTG